MPHFYGISYLIMNNEIKMPESPNGYKWTRTSIEGFGNPARFTAYYELHAIKSHREDGTPLEIDPIPEMPDNVERVEYFGMGMETEDMGDADAYICLFKNGEEWYYLEHIEEGLADKHPCSNEHCHYARIWYKKPKTQLSELIGEDGQKNAYLHWDDGSWDVFKPACQSDNTNQEWELNDVTHNLKTTGVFREDAIKWSHSPFTTYEDANQFNF